MLDVCHAEALREPTDSKPIDQATFVTIRCKSLRELSKVLIVFFLKKEVARLGSARL